MSDATRFNAEIVLDPETSYEYPLEENRRLQITVGSVPNSQLPVASVKTREYTGCFTLDKGLFMSEQALYDLHKAHPAITEIRAYDAPDRSIRLFISGLGDGVLTLRDLANLGKLMNHIPMLTAAIAEEIDIRFVEA